MRYLTVALALSLLIPSLAEAGAGVEAHESRLIVKGPGHGFRVMKNLGRGRQLVEIPDGMSVGQAIAALRGRVEYAEPDYIWTIDLSANDPFYPQGYWHHDIMGSEAAWDVTTGDPSVVIGIVDTGVDLHDPDIAPKWAGGFDFYNDQASQYPGTGWDTQGHGSHVAGLAAAIGGNFVKSVGLCWGCSIKSYKFLNGKGSGFTSDAVLAIDQAVADGTPILNNSWGGGAFSQALLDSINAACDAGILFVAAAGNNNRDTDVTSHYPSSYDAPCILSVGSTDREDERSYFSNYGAVTVDLFAPGSIVNSLPGPEEGSQTRKPHNYAAASKSGTSMASPQVAGCAGLLLSVNPGWQWQELMDTILSTVDIIPAAAPTVSGGRLNCAAALGAEPPAPFCGDGSCEGDETCSTCPADCGDCPPLSFCGDGECLEPEYCAKGKKIAGKHACSQDCPSANGHPSVRYCCGNGIEEPAEFPICPNNP